MKISLGNFDQFTDYSATYVNCTTLFNNLQSQITADDFLFVWVYGRNYGPQPGTEDRTIELFNGDELWDYEFYNLVSDPLLQAHRKVVWMDCWFAGGFYDEFLTEDNIFWIGSGNYNGWEMLANDTYTDNGINYPVTENEIINQATYFHGEFDFHLYSSTMGQSPKGGTNYAGTDYSTADLNNDNIISVLESYNWAYTWHNGEFVPNGPKINNNLIGSSTSLEYPTILHTTYASDRTRRGLIGVTKDFNVSNTYTLTIKEDAIVHFLNSADITVDAGATLVIEDDVTLISKSGTRRITVNGDISIGDNVKFIGEDGAQLYLELNNTSDILTISGCEFDDAGIFSDVANLTLTSCEFISSGLYGFKGDYTLSSCIFDESFAHFDDATYSNSKVTISNVCTFNDSPVDAIKIDDYPDFTINNCTINNGDAHGINLLNSGDGRVINSIENCVITNNNSSTRAGVIIYNTSVDILNNEITDNYYGIKCNDNSNVYIKGNAHLITQRIADNNNNEIFATSGSFPYYIKWNAIIDEDNPQPLVKYYSPFSSQVLYVSNNYWGNNFNYLTDLYPAADYVWQPIWNPPGTKSGEIGEALYFIAKQKIAEEDYTGAKADLKEVVKQYPQSHFAQAALRDIFEIEKYGEEDYVSLKSYYTSNQYVQSTELLIRRGEFFANLCDIKLENWEVAINWYENIIQYPANEEDPIFAIIDLGYLYLLMENGGYKSTYSGTMLEHKPKSVVAFNEKTDYLLSLIPGEQLSDAILSDLEELKAGELMQNIPNPFNSSTQIWYKLNNDSNVSIDVFNTSSSKIKTYNLGSINAGVSSVEFKPDNVNPGIYLYTLYVNGVVTDARKMTVIK